MLCRKKNNPTSRPQIDQDCDLEWKFYPRCLRSLILERFLIFNVFFFSNSTSQLLCQLWSFHAITTAIRKKTSELALFKNSASPPPPLGLSRRAAAPPAAAAAARLAEAEHTEQVVSSEVMDPLCVSHSWATHRPFFMQMRWHSTRVAAVKITRSQEERWRKGDGSWNTTPLLLASVYVCVSLFAKMLETALNRNIKKNPDLLKSDGPDQTDASLLSLQFLGHLMNLNAASAPLPCFCPPGNSERAGSEACQRAPRWSASKFCTPSSLMSRTPATPLPPTDSFYSSKLPTVAELCDSLNGKKTLLWLRPKWILLFVRNRPQCTRKGQCTSSMISILNTLGSRRENANSPCTHLVWWQTTTSWTDDGHN